QYICRQGEQGDEAYIVYRGEVEVILESEGREKIIYLAKRGDCLGEMAIMGSIPRTASLRTRGDVRLLVIMGDDFISLLRQDADISVELMKLLANRLNDFLSMGKQ
ncbi:MAG: cyclic nucleotide-binding domain-containing protein, partial [Deltaproteobacteria bacterium]|nr:cyclic nucleotide-binding domain-containing protein [Deltaproteobacteria bacterium]